MLPTDKRMHDIDTSCVSCGFRRMNWLENYRTPYREYESWRWMCSVCLFQSTMRGAESERDWDDYD